LVFVKDGKYIFYHSKDDIQSPIGKCFFPGFLSATVKSWKLLKRLWSDDDDDVRIMMIMAAPIIIMMMLIIMIRTMVLMMPAITMSC
jgi:hypothetical protein